MTVNKTMLLTTVDNPYSPFDDWTRWLNEDIRLGYNTSGLVANFAAASEVTDTGAEIDAMRRIIALNASGRHVVVVSSDFDPFLKDSIASSS